MGKIGKNQMPFEDGGGRRLHSCQFLKVFLSRSLGALK